MNKPPLSIALFGPMAVLVEGEPLPPVRSRKVLYLLALLTLRQGRPVEREWLAGTLWPDADQSQALANLRPALSQLRAVLGPAASRLLAPSQRTLQLDLSGAEVDVLVFDATIGSKHLETIERATAVYKGPLLEGCSEEWVFQERDARKQTCLEALQWLGQEAMRRGDYVGAATLLRRAGGIDPLSDSAHRALMEALAKSGDRNAALDLYRGFSERLRRELGAPPDTETTTLYRRLRQESRGAVIGGADGSETSSRSSASLSAMPVVAGHLPHPVTELIGREDECLEAASRLRRSRLVTLVGPGGIGKTRLAVAIAQKVVSEYPDNVWLISLEALPADAGNDPGETAVQRIAQQIASVFGVKEGAVSALHSVTEHLRTKKLLLVLDNCEHVLESSAAVTGRLLRECSAVRILATSRAALAISGETVWMVPALAVPDPETLPEGRTTLGRAAAGFEGIQLFVERAQAMGKLFAMTGDNAREVIRLCWRLAGVPLALELAAARTALLTPAQILAQLEAQPLDALAARHRDIPARHRTLRATLEWSHALLPAQAQAMLANLGAFRGGWTPEAAQAVCPDGKADALELLTILHDASLIDSIDDGDSRKRFTMLETVRQYAVEKLEAGGNSAQVRAKHRDWSITLAEEAEPHLRGPEQGLWLRRLDRERDNLRAALEWSNSDPDGMEAGLRLAGALPQFWNQRGDYSEGRHYLERALGRSEPQTTATRAQALDGAGILAVKQGDDAAGETHFQESLKIWRTLDNKTRIALLLQNLGIIAFKRGDTLKARALYEESLRLHQELGNKHGMARARVNLGNLLLRSDLAAAEAHFDQSLALSRETGDRHNIALVLENLCFLASERCDYPTAQALAEESLAIAREDDNKSAIATVLSSLGSIYLSRNNPIYAQSCFEESLTILNQIGELPRKAWAMLGLGNVARVQRELAPAHTWYQQSHRLFVELGNQIGEGCALHGLGRVAKDRTEWEAAQSLYQQSITVSLEAGYKSQVQHGLCDLAEVMFQKEDWRKAAQLWGAAEAIRESLGQPLPPSEQAGYDRLVERTQAVLGADTFTAAWAEGRAISWERIGTWILETGTP